MFTTEQYNCFGSIKIDNSETTCHFFNVLCVAVVLSGFRISHFWQFSDVNSCDIFRAFKSNLKIKDKTWCYQLIMEEIASTPRAEGPPEETMQQYGCTHYKRKCKFVVSTPWVNIFCFTLPRELLLKILPQIQKIYVVYLAWILLSFFILNLPKIYKE